MATVPREDGLAVYSEPEERPGDGAGPDGEEPAGHAQADQGADDHELASLRDAFVDAFNGRDLDGVLALVVTDVDCPDIPGDGVEVLAEELDAIWERSPGAMLTQGRLAGGEPCAVAWLPDEDGCWSRAALVCFDHAHGQLTLVAVPDDADALERAEAVEPIGDELDEWVDWGEWERGESTLTRPRDGEADPRAARRGRA